MNKEKFVFYKNVETYLLLERILINNPMEFIIPIYQRNSNLSSNDKDNLILTHTNLNLEYVKTVKINITKDLVKNLSKKDIEKYEISIEDYSDNSSMCTKERVSLIMDVDNFTNLMLKFMEI